MHKYKQNKKQTFVNFFFCQLMVELYPVQKRVTGFFQVVVYIRQMLITI